jgi:hypothetical protein
MKPEQHLSGQQPAEQQSQPQPGEDGIQELLRVAHIPLTRKAYLEVAGLTEPLGGELEMELPKEIRNM